MILVQTMRFFLQTSYFFSLFAQQVNFFKSKLQQFFYFLEKITHQKCKRKQHIEFLLDHKLPIEHIMRRLVLTNINMDLSNFIFYI